MMFLSRQHFSAVTRLLIPFFGLSLILLEHQNAKADALENARIALGQKLYFDTRLSFNNSQSCASCHDPNAGFVDPRKTINGAVSLGADGKSLGDRSAPTASYANQIPPFTLNQDGIYQGGQFWDGRVMDLKAQAAGPILNPIEMAMPSKQAAVERIHKDPSYQQAFAHIYGEEIFDNTEAAYAAIAESIAAFEETPFFSPFDSKYDRYLEGTYQPTQTEELGMTLFFSEQFSNCNQCHQLKPRPSAPGETFSNYEYHNIGVPINEKARTRNGSDPDYRDEGLLANPQVNDPSQAGKFKVPTLRNVAVTAPYMHNGVFQDLRTVVAFYNKFNSKSEKRQINPETGNRWREPEIDQNLSMELLTHGPALDDKRIDALVAFMRMLTDKRFERLLD